MLTIWTSASTGAVQDAFAGVLRSFKPNIPKHRFLSWEADNLVPAEAGEVVLVCGAKAVDELRKAKLVHKGRTLNALREVPVKSPQGGWYMVTHDPHTLNSSPDLREVVEWDVRLTERLMRTGTTEPDLGDYQWVNSFQPVIDYVEAEYKKCGKPVDVAMDTETMSFYPWYPDRDIVSISFTAEPETAHALYLGSQPPPIALDPSVNLFEQVQWLLTTPKIKLRGANLKYDLIWIAVKWGIECANFKFDTMLVGSLLNENRSNSLNLHAKIMTPLGGYDDQFNRTFDKGHMERVPTKDLLPYAAGDTDACQRVADVLKDELLTEPKLANFYVTILHPAARAFEKIERRGIVADVQKFNVLGDDLRRHIKEAQDKAMSILPNRMKIKHREKIDEQLKAGKSPLTPAILKEFFFTPHGLNLKPKETTPKTGEPSMAKSHLRQFAHTPEAAAMVEALTDHDSAAKTLSTFVEGFLKHLRPDGKFHPTYFLAKGEFEGHEDEDGGTTTGRLSAKDPPIQVTPKKTFWAKRIRECFPAPKGKVVLQLDYEQGELKVVACISNEQTMLSAYRKGLDLHAVTGAQLASIPLEEFLSYKNHTDTALAAIYDKNRSNAKPANFGLLYGMGAEGFQAYAWANYGVKLTLDEATEMRNAFFGLYSGLLDYHGKQKSIVRHQKRVWTPMGRVRHLPTVDSWDRAIRALAERQAINSPVQGTLTDMLIWAIALFEDAYPASEVEIVAMIHDAMIAYVPEDEVELWAGRIVEIMSNLPFHEVNWKPQLKFTADAEAGADLAHLSKLKLAT